MEPDIAMRTSFTIPVLALLTAAAVAVAPATGTPSRTITVQGTGIVTTVPDEAQFTFGVSTTASTAKAALGANAARMNRLIAALKAAGIAPADIQTAQISLSPNTNENASKVLSFTASNSVTLKTKQIAKAGSIVDAAVAAGANLVSGPSLGPSDQRLLQRRALKAAVADAHGRALAIAQAAHVKLGAVISVSETSSSPVQFAPTAKAASSSGTPVEPGSVQVEEDVTAIFAIR
jgi:uncharacterized protein YggE